VGDFYILDQAYVMNFALIAAISAVVFFAAKMALQYTKTPDPKGCIQDAVLAFASCLVGLYGYQQYAPKELQTKNLEVFTERPNF
jgi:hypothetical protein